MITEKIAVSHWVEGFTFALANLADSQTDTAVPHVESSVNQAVALYDGYVFAITGALSAAVTAGTLTFDFSIGGTAQAVDKTLATAATTEYRYEFPVGTYRFSAGQTIGVTYTSNGSLEPNTTDLLAKVYVVYNGKNL